MVSYDQRKHVNIYKQEPYTVMGFDGEKSLEIHRLKFGQGRISSFSLN